jgi:hypothetical protein
MRARLASQELKNAPVERFAIRVRKSYFADIFSARVACHGGANKGHLTLLEFVK